MRNRRILVIGGFIAALLAATASADTISTWNGGTGNWSTAADWTPPAVPNNSATTAYDVTIGAASSQVGLDVSPTINSLNLTGGILYGAPNVNPQLTVTNNANVNNGAIVFGVLGPPPNGPGSLSVGGDLNMGTSSALYVYNGSVIVGGNFTGAIGMASASGRNDQFRVAGTLTNTGFTSLGNDRCFSLMGCPAGSPPLPGPLPGPTVTAGTVVNNGTINSWSTITSSTLVNNGTTSLIGSIATIGTLQNAGTIYLANAAGSRALEETAGLNVGTGTPNVGYNQFADGTFDEVLSGSSTYGRIIAPRFFNPPGGPQGYPINLDGTLDIMLGNGFTPTIGESFTLITTAPDDIFGRFSNVVWDTFDNGQGGWVVSYDNAAGQVVITAELVPEPSTWMLLAAAAIPLAFLYSRTRTRES
jgi:hypothetical protein